MEKRLQNEKLKISIVALVRRIRMGRSSSLVRTLALRAKGRRFKSGSAHHNSFSFAYGTFDAISRIPNKFYPKVNLHFSLYIRGL